MPSCPTAQDTFTFKLSIADISGNLHNGTHSVKLNCPGDGDGGTSNEEQERDDDNSND
jgi:hypothetical protein